MNAGADRFPHELDGDATPRSRARIEDTTHSPSGRHLEAQGQIQHIAPEPDGAIRIAGWSGSSLGGPTRFTASCGARTLTIEAMDLGLPSPGTARFVPQLANAETAGFRILARGIDDVEGVRGELLRLTPFFGDEAGLDLMGVILPVIEPPSAADLALVSQNLPVAFEFLGYFQELCGLQPDAKVLDVGCGVGRMAFALAHHLSAAGTYDGLDIVESYIDVAKRCFARLPHFHFRHCNVANGQFNPAGDIPAVELAFPHPDHSFDFVLLTSVFTHMRPPEVQHYIDEIARVLEPGGRCLVTAFLMNEEARASISAGAASLALRPSGMGFFCEDPAKPEAAIGFEETEFLRWWIERGFAIERVLRGSWCGRARFSCFQDVLIASRP